MDVNVRVNRAFFSPMKGSNVHSKHSRNTPW